MSSEAQEILIYVGVLIIALIPLMILYGFALHDRNRAEQRVHQLERVVDQCAEILKPMARHSALLADCSTNNVMTRHQRKHDENLQAAARAIDVVRGEASPVYANVVRGDRP